MIRRYLDRHIRRAVAWEEHVGDALDLFEPQPDGCPLCPPVAESFDDAFLYAHGIETL